MHKGIVLLREDAEFLRRITAAAVHIKKNNDVMKEGDKLCCKSSKMMGS